MHNCKIVEIYIEIYNIFKHKINITDFFYMGTVTIHLIVFWRHSSHLIYNYLYKPIRKYCYKTVNCDLKKITLLRHFPFKPTHTAGFNHDSLFIH